MERVRLQLRDEQREPQIDAASVTILSVADGLLVLEYGATGVKDGTIQILAIQTTVPYWNQLTGETTSEQASFVRSLMRADVDEAFYSITE